VGRPRRLRHSTIMTWGAVPGKHARPGQAQRVLLGASCAGDPSGRTSSSRSARGHSACSWLVM